jgi:hypothetical protein
VPVPAQAGPAVATASEADNQGTSDLSKKKQRQLLKEQKRGLASKGGKNEPQASKDVVEVPVVKPEPASQKLPSMQPQPMPPLQAPAPATVIQDVNPSSTIPKATASTIALGLARARVRSSVYDVLIFITKILSRVSSASTKRHRQTVMSTQLVSLS